VTASNEDCNKPTKYRHALIALFLCVQIGAPLSYYIGSRRYDERFAWRMFSPIRMVRCNVRFVGVKSGRSGRLRMSREVSQTWTAWMQRGNRRVVRGFARHWCDENHAASPRLTVDLTCPLPNGTLDRPIPVEQDLCAD